MDVRDTAFKESACDKDVGLKSHEVLQQRARFLIYAAHLSKTAVPICECCLIVCHDVSRPAMCPSNSGILRSSSIYARPKQVLGYHGIERKRLFNKTIATGTRFSIAHWAISTGTLQTVSRIGCTSADPLLQNDGICLLYTSPSPRD